MQRVPDCKPTITGFYDNRFVSLYNCVIWNFIKLIKKTNGKL